MSQWWYLLFSYFFIFAVIGLAQVVLKWKLVNADTSRKIIHIGVAHWWFIAYFGFQSLWVAMIGPLSFILLNFLSERFSLVEAMDDGTGRNWGTVYFPISLAILVYLSWSGLVPMWIGGASILVLGWADGMASVVGKALGRGRITIFGNDKSYLGSAVFFVFAIAVIAGFMYAFTGSVAWVPLILTALMTSVIEAVTPFGLDNLTVPMAACFLLLGLAA